MKTEGRSLQRAFIRQWWNIWKVPQQFFMRQCAASSDQRTLPDFGWHLGPTWPEADASPTQMEGKDHHLCSRVCHPFWLRWPPFFCVSHDMYFCEGRLNWWCFSSNQNPCGHNMTGEVLQGTCANKIWPVPLYLYIIFMSAHSHHDFWMHLEPRPKTAKHLRA